MQKHTRPIVKLFVAGGLALAPFTLVACGDDSTGPEQGVSAGDIADEGADNGGDNEVDNSGLIYDGLYDSDFYNDSDTYVGEEVTVSATVNDVIDANSFTIAGTDDTSVEPLLIVGADMAADVEEGQVVQVTGTVQDGFDEVTVEDDLGVDLTDDGYSDFADGNYIAADSIDTSVPAENN